MIEKSETTKKELVVSKKDESPKYWMSKGEYTNIIVSAQQTNNEYVINGWVL